MNNFYQYFRDHCDQQRMMIPQGENFSQGDLDIVLRRHQQEGMAKVCAALEDQKTAFSLAQSCGSGKTYLAGNLFIASQKAKRESQNYGEDRIDVILADSKAQIETLYSQLSELGLDIGVLGSGKKDIDHPVVIASMQSLQSREKKEKFSLPFDKVDVLIGDEADVYLTSHRMQIINLFSKAIKIGLTATEQWKDGRHIKDLWGDVIHRMPLQEGILTGVNVPPLFHLFEAKIDDTDIVLRGGEYDQKSLAAAMKNAEIQKAIPEVYESLVLPDQRKCTPTLIYVPSVYLVHEVQKEMDKRFKQDGIVIRSWTGDKTTTQCLHNDVQDFNEGNLDILICCEMGGRALNVSGAQCIIDAFSTLSPTKLEQRHGRGMRTHKDKSFVSIAQIIPKSHKFRPYLLVDLLDCWDDFREGRLMGLSGEVDGKFYDKTKDLNPDVLRKISKIQERIEVSAHVHVDFVQKIDIYEQLQLRMDLPKVDIDGRIYIDGKKYVTLFMLSKILKMSPVTIDKYLKREKIIAQRGLSVNGHVDLFFDEARSIQICNAGINNLPQADKNGVILINGEEFRTKANWAKHFLLPASAVVNTFNSSDIESIEGRISAGNKGEFYSFTDAKIICKDLFFILPQSDTDRILRKDGKEYKTISAWSQDFNLYPKIIKQQLCMSGIEGITGKMYTGPVYQFYTQKEIEVACDYYLQLPICESVNSVFETNNERYAVLKMWSQELGLSVPVVRRELKTKDVQSYTMRAHDGKIQQCYKENEVLNAFQGVLLHLPVANKDGVLYYNETEYRTLYNWGKYLNLSEKIVTSRVKYLENVMGKLSDGNTAKFYPESCVKHACQDVLRSLPEAEKDGFFEQDGQKYGGVTAWARYFGIGGTTLRRWMQGENLKTLQGKNTNGRFMQFYLHSEIEELVENKKLKK